MSSKVLTQVGISPTSSAMPSREEDTVREPAGDDFDQLMDDTQVLYGLQAGDIVSQAEVDALNRLDDYWRKNADDAVAAYSQGVDEGRREAGGTDVASLLDKLAEFEVLIATEKAMRRFDEQRLRIAVLDNVRAELRPEVECALELAFAGSRTASQAPGKCSEAERPAPNSTSALASEEGEKTDEP